MIIESVDNIKSWEQLKEASKEADRICSEFKKKYKLWNYPDFQVTVFFKRFGKTEIGNIDLQAINLKTGESRMDYYVGYNLEVETINLRKMFKKSSSNSEEVKK